MIKNWKGNINEYTFKLKNDIALPGFAQWIEQQPAD